MVVVIKSKARLQGTATPPSLGEEVTVIEAVAKALPSSRGRPSRAVTPVLRALEQPDRQPHLWRTEEALDALERRPEARKLDLGQAKRRALALDGRLRGEDLEEW